MSNKIKEQLHCYFRVSSSIQEKGASLEVKDMRGRKIAEERGLEYIPYPEGSASSHSETLDKRPQLQKLLLKIRDGDVKHIFAWDMDRLSRNKRVSSLVLMDMEDKDSHEWNEDDIKNNLLTKLIGKEQFIPTFTFSDCGLHDLDITFFDNDKNEYTVEVNKFSSIIKKYYF